MVTTHLICPAPEGSKYEASVKWGVPAVTKEWLLKCVTCKRRLSEDKFPVNNGKLFELYIFYILFSFKILIITFLQLSY